MNSQNLILGIVCAVLMNACSIPTKNPLPEDEGVDKMHHLLAEPDLETDGAMLITQWTTSGTNIYVKNTDGSTGSLLIHGLYLLEDLFVSSAAYHHGNLYVKRDMHGVPRRSLVEIWQYNKLGGNRIASAEGYGFAVTTQSSFVATGSNQGVVFIHNTQNTSVINAPIPKVVPSDLDGNTNYPPDSDHQLPVVLSVLHWSADGKYLWGEASLSHPMLFFRISASDWKMEKFPLPPELSSFIGEYSLNPDTSLIAYSDYGFFEFPERVIETEDFPVTLYLYNFETKTREKIATTSVKKTFSPEWLDSHTLSFNDPETQKMKVIEIQ